MDEKLKFWKGQKIMILPFREGDPPTTCYPLAPCSQLRRYSESEGFTDMRSVTRAEFYKPYADHGLRSDEYALKTGTILSPEFEECTRLVIRIRGTKWNG